MGIAFATANRLPRWLGALAPRLGSRFGTRSHGRQRQSAADARPAPALRVLRVFEPHQPRAAAGRMVISGRMADVCAELERLAAAEAAQAPR